MAKVLSIARALHFIDLKQTTLAGKFPTPSLSLIIFSPLSEPPLPTDADISPSLFIGKC